MEQHEENTDSLRGGWFTTSDLKLAVALNTAGFPFKRNAEVTRTKMPDGRDSFHWHLETVNTDGEDIAAFLPLWDHPTDPTVPRPCARAIFLWAREAMLARTHILTESHKADNGGFVRNGGKRLYVTSRLGKRERDQLAQMAS